MDRLGFEETEEIFSKREEPLAVAMEADNDKPVVREPSAAPAPSQPLILFPPNADVSEKTNCLLVTVTADDIGRMRFSLLPPAPASTPEKVLVTVLFEVTAEKRLPGGAMIVELVREAVITTSFRFLVIAIPIP